MEPDLDTPPAGTADELVLRLRAMAWPRPRPALRRSCLEQINRRIAEAERATAERGPVGRRDAYDFSDLTGRRGGRFAC